MPSAQVVILYPREKGATFDKDYYLSSHMAMVAKHWKKHGLKSYAVTELNEDAEYMISCILEFESLEGFGAAVADPITKEVMGDVEKFSNVKPVLMHGGVIGQKQV
jgi:uncharacterized protein (TIGR02118 family)